MTHFQSEPQTRAAQGWTWINGRIVADKDAHISVMDHGFLFGDSVYETIRTWGGRPFLLQEHLARLERSARGVCIPLPPGVEEAIEAVLRHTATLALKAKRSSRMKHRDGPALSKSARGSEERLLRVILTRGTGPVGYEVEPSQIPTLIVLSRPLPAIPQRFYQDGMSLAVVSTRRNSRSALDPALKTSNLLNLRMAYMEARRLGADDAILLNHQGDVAESSGSNIFLVQQGRLATPILDVGILQGITRNFVLHLAQEAGIATSEERLTLEHLRQSEEIFLTSTTRSIMPVSKLDGEAIGQGIPGPLTLRLIRCFEERVGHPLC